MFGMLMMLVVMFGEVASAPVAIDATFFIVCFILLIFSCLNFF
jgi:hypothetical protein